MIVVVAALGTWATLSVVAVFFAGSFAGGVDWDDVDWDEDFG